MSMLFGIKLEGCRNYIHKCLLDDNLKSPYYPSELITLYYISKYIIVSEDKELKKAFLKAFSKYQFKDLESFEKILYLLIKTGLNQPIEEQWVDETLQLQNDDGSLEPLPICYDYRSEGDRTFTGSKYASTAYFIELLLNLLGVPLNDYDEEFKVKASNEIIPTMTQIEDQISNDMAIFGESARIDELMTEKNRHRFEAIPLLTALEFLPDLFTNQINKEKVSILKSFTLGLFYISSAYTFLDDYIDSDNHRQILLNSTLIPNLVRKGWDNVTEVGKQYPDFQYKLDSALKSTDIHYFSTVKSNGPKVSDISYIESRMKPYLLGMSYIPWFLGTMSSPSDDLYLLFKAFVVIDQLNDDLNDWKDDLVSGGDSYVISLFKGKHQEGSSMDKTLFESVLPDIYQQCEIQYLEGLNALKNLKLEDSYLADSLEYTYRPIKMSKVEHGNSIRLLEEFTK
jgi:hypothetical protein